MNDKTICLLAAIGFLIHNADSMALNENIVSILMDEKSYYAADKYEIARIALEGNDIAVFYTVQARAEDGCKDYDAVKNECLEQGIMIASSEGVVSTNIEQFKEFARQMMHIDSIQFDKKTTDLEAIALSLQVGDLAKKIEDALKMYQINQNNKFEFFANRNERHDTKE